MRYLFPFSLLVAALALWLAADVIEASAYEVYGTKWVVPVTYDGDPQAGAALDKWASVSNLELGGISPHPGIRVRRPNPWPYGASTLGMAVINWDSIGITGCTVDVPPWSSDATMLHEIGHCLGLAHSTTPLAIMMAIEGMVDLQKDDIAGIQYLYGKKDKPVIAPVFRYWLPSIAKY